MVVWLIRDGSVGFTRLISLLAIHQLVRKIIGTGNESLCWIHDKLLCYLISDGINHLTSLTGISSVTASL